MSLQDQLLKNGLIEAKNVEIPSTWNKCEIHGLPKTNVEKTPVLIPLWNGQAGISITPWDDGRLTIHPGKCQHEPKKFNPVLQKTLDDIKKLHPQCEILWY